MKYYNAEERKKIKETIIPQKHISEFIEIIDKLFQDNKDKHEWKNRNQLIRNKNLMIFCIGKDNTEKWFKGKGLIN